jgi:D-serine deaminase-like pyridoxal phosphate-dependent protein
VKVTELVTPCLLVDRRALDANLARMAAFFEGRRAKLRPHFKSHKCATIARRQIAAGNCVGISCATLGEAGVLVEADLGDVLIANQLTDPEKLAGLARLNANADVKICVDCAEHLPGLSAAAVDAGVQIGVLVELDVGMGRCGVSAAEPVVALAGRIAECPGLKFCGIQAYEGHAVLQDDPAEREQRARAALRLSGEVRAAVEAAGHEVAMLSSAGTGTYDISGAAEHVDEVQAGSYALMDAKYSTVRPEFENALFILASCISSGAERAIFDVGCKGCGGEFGPPEVAGLAVQPEFRKLSEEHLRIDGLEGKFKIGQKIRLIPSHGCTTCNLYARLHIIEGDQVVEEWPIEAAGLRN